MEKKRVDLRMIKREIIYKADPLKFLIDNCRVFMRIEFCSIGIIKNSVDRRKDKSWRDDISKIIVKGSFL